MSLPFWVRRALLVVIAVFLGCTALILLALALIDMRSGGRQKVLIGSIDSDSIAAVTMMVAFGLIGVALCLIPVPRTGLLLMVPARFLAFAAIWPALWAFSADAIVTPLLSDGCETGYVVEEQRGLFDTSGTIYEPNGLLAATVARTGHADGLRFAHGEYIAERNGHSLDIWYRDTYSNPGPITDIGEPTLTIPALPARNCAT